MPHDIKTLVQGYLQLNRSSKDHLPDEPGDSSFSKELVITLTGGVRVAALHHAPGVFGKVALQNTLLGNSSQLPCKNLQSNTERFDTVVKPYMTIIMCVTVESHVSDSPDYVAYTGPAE